MDLVLVTGRFPQRSETFVYRKAVSLANHGHRVTVLTREIGDWSLYPDPLPATLNVEQLPPTDSLAGARAIAAAWAAFRSGVRHPRGAHELYARCEATATSIAEARRHFIRHLPFVGRSADVIHFEFLGLAVMYPLAGHTAHAPVIASCRGQDVHTLDLRPAAERDTFIKCLQQATALHCVSDEMRRSVEQISGRREGVWVNRPAVDTGDISPRPTPTSTENRRLKLTASGRLVWVKGYDYLLAAFARLADRGVDFEAEIVGDGDLRSVLRFSIGDLGLADRVKLVGGVSSADVLARLQTTDVFVLSSLQEGISNAVLEAMASGVPIVTTAAGGMPEAVTDGVEGLVVPIRDVEALANAIAKLANNPEQRRSMGRAARARAEHDFSLEGQVATFERMYRSVRGASA